MDYEVRIQDKAERTVLAVRETVRLEELGESIGACLAALYSRAGVHGLGIAGPPEVAYLSDFSLDGLDIEVRVPIAGSQPGAAQVDAASVVTLPAQRCVCTVHTGPYERLGDAYRALEQWLAEQPYDAAGPAIETYVTGPDETSSPDDYRTEITIPIEKRVHSAPVGA